MENLENKFTERITITIDPETLSRLDELGNSENRNRSNMLRQLIIAEYTRRHPELKPELINT